MTSSFNGIPNNTHPTWWKDPAIRRNCIWIACCAFGSSYSGYDSSLLSGLLALPKFQEKFPIVVTNSNILGLVTASQFLPGLVSPFVASWLADKYDRKAIMTLGAVGVIIGAVVQATSHSLGQFIGSRVIIGIVSTMSQGINPTMLVEIAHPRIRSVASALCLTFFFIGGIIAAWTTFGTLQHFPQSSWSWRLPCLLQCLIPTLILPLCILIPHSPRWLVSKGRVEDARQVLATQHANGQLDDPLVEYEIREIEHAIQLERESAGTTYSSFLKTPGNRKRLFLVMTIAFGGQWDGVGVVFYYIVPVLRSLSITNPTTQTLLQGGITIASWLCSLTGAFLVEKAGRRPLWISSTTIMVVSLIMITALSATFAKNPNPGIGGGIVAFFYLVEMGYTLAWTPLNFAYNVEILPYNLRTKGMAIWALINNLALVMGIWINSVALAHLGWKWYIMYVVFDTYLLIVIIFMFPETKGLSLEEVAIRFDGDAADVILRDRERNQLTGTPAFEDYKDDKVTMIEGKPA